MNGMESTDRAGVDAARLGRALVDGTADLVCAFDDTGTVHYLNQAGLEILQLSEEEAIGRNIVEHLHPDELERALSLITANVERGEGPRSAAPYRLRRTDGDWEALDIGVVRVDELTVAVGRRVRDHEILDLVIEQLTAGAPLDEVLDLLPTFDAWRNPTEACTVRCATEDGPDIVVGTPLPDVLSGADRSPATPWARASTHEDDVVAGVGDLPDPLADQARALGFVACRVAAVPDPRGLPDALVTVWCTDGGPPVQIHAYPISTIVRILSLVLAWEQKASALRHSATHDALTGLPNRAAFFDAFTGLESHPDHADAAPVTVLYLDLDRFKPVNDRLGHAAGDAVLREVARRIRSVLRPGDLVARIGGDEFAVLCPGLDAGAHSDTLAARLLATLGEPIRIGDELVEVGASIGVARGSVGDRTADELLEAADTSLYRAKSAGGHVVME